MKLSKARFSAPLDVVAKGVVDVAMVVVDVFKPVDVEEPPSLIGDSEEESLFSRRGCLVADGEPEVHVRNGTKELRAWLLIPRLK